MPVLRGSPPATREAMLAPTVLVPEHMVPSSPLIFGRRPAPVHRGLAHLIRKDLKQDVSEPLQEGLFMEYAVGKQGEMLWPEDFEVGIAKRGAEAHTITQQQLSFRTGGGA